MREQYYLVFKCKHQELERMLSCYDTIDQYNRLFPIVKYYEMTVIGNKNYKNE